MRALIFLLLLLVPTIALSGEVKILSVEKASADQIWIAKVKISGTQGDCLTINSEKNTAIYSAIVNESGSCTIHLAGPHFSRRPLRAFIATGKMRATRSINNVYKIEVPADR